VLVMGMSQAGAVSLLRDPDIEHALSILAQPVLTAAGLGQSVRVLVVDERTVNAFVVDSRHIFLHWGLVVKMSSAAMLQAVIAHEAAHIANGHLVRRRSNLGNARTAAAFGIAVAALAGAASGRADAALGVAIGTQSSALRSFLAHTRAEEASADHSSVRYMVQAGVDPGAAVEVQQLFVGQDLLEPSRRDLYARTHPPAQDRVRALRGFAAAYEGANPPDPDAAYWFARARGKLSAFLRPPKSVLRARWADEPPDVTLMRQAVAHFRQSQPDTALGLLQEAMALRPNDPFFYELKGQILLQSRRFDAAVEAYRQAVDLAPDNALCLGGYGRALLAAGQPRQARPILERAYDVDFRDTRLLRDLGLAYAQLGQKGMAALATAERYALQGRLEDAKIHAKRAQDLLAEGTQGWQRAADITRTAERMEERSR